MRPVTRRIRIELFVPLYFFLFGCGTTSAPPRPTVAKKHNDAQPSEKRLQKQAERVSELEIRIAMLESAVREIRADAKRSDLEKRAQTIRIGRSSNSGSSSESLEIPIEESEQRDERGDRLTLRLYGRSRSTSTSREEPFVVPEPPPSIPKKLSVVPLPKRGTVARVAGEKFQTDNSDSRAGVTEYRTALGFVRRRKYEQALQTLSDFIEKYPKSEYMDSAIYWRGEVYYAKRAYRNALEQFQVVTTRFPASRKMPDSLLKIGMCHKRLGDFERARALFSRLRRQYPKSNAARIASLESSS